MAYASRKAAQRRRRRLERRIYWFVLLVALFFLGLTLFLNQQFVRVSDIRVTGNIQLSEQDIQSETETFFSSGFNVIPADSIFFLSTNQVERYLMTEFSRIESVRVSRDFFQGLDIDVTERVRRYRYCSQGQGCWYMDDKGYVFAQESENDAENLFVFRKYSTVPVSTYFLETELFEDIVLLINTIESSGLSIDEAYVANESTLVLETSGGTKLLFDTQREFDSAYTNFVKLLESESFRVDADAKSFVSDIAYINFRFGDKIFYCFTGEVCEMNY